MHLFVCFFQCFCLIMNSFKRMMGSKYSTSHSQSHAMYTRNKTIENAMLVGVATQTNKKHTNKCVDGSTHYRIKVGLPT